MEAPKSDVHMVDAGPCNGGWLSDNLLEAFSPKSHPQRVVASLTQEVEVEVATQDRVNSIIQVLCQDLHKLSKAFHVCWIW